MLNIVVVFPKKEIVLKMKNVLIKNGFDVSAVCVTGAQAIQAVERLEAGVVVCGIRFADMIYNELKDMKGEKVKIEINLEKLKNGNYVKKVIAIDDIQLK